MQFVRQGPDIPERLLQEHEDGRVVFFCGAGISYPARLPGFAGLTRRLFDEVGVVPNSVQSAAIKAGQFDTTIGLLEASVVGGREKVRRALANILTPDLSVPNATSTHEAMLTLGRNREGRTRLITTNFDRLFEEVITRKGESLERYRAPLLPVPKNRWDGLVYLHGLLSQTPTASELDCLVLSSGDFGLAYLTERWAARFVSELFRNYTVCFVGYSINDPVLRYMMDALAADRLLGESPPEMFAFGSYSKGQEDDRANEWCAKNVTPILYREHNHHAYLHKTLRVWAETYRDGVRGKERIVVECAMARPQTSTKQDDFVGRLLWALSDPRGYPAQQFADLDPVPPLDWLELLCDERYSQRDLSRFGVMPNKTNDDKLTFSLVRRPSPYTLAPLMALVSANSTSSRWDRVMEHLARWLTRHLDDPALVLWLAKHGGHLNYQLAWTIENRLNELTNLERNGDFAKLDSIRANAPRAVPRPWMQTLWRVLLTGRVKSPASDLNIHRWQKHFERGGMTATLRVALREILTPRILLRTPFRLSIASETDEEPLRLKDLVDWEIVLSAGHVHYAIRTLSKNPQWSEALPHLLADFTALLRDALELMRELDDADDKRDLTYIHQPSISDHPQNKDFRDWTVLIELARDAWLATAKLSPERAQIEANIWWQTPYPLFRRLAFFAATQENVIAPQRGLTWLLSDHGWWLWSSETKREAIRLLIALAAKLDVDSFSELEGAILAGPQRALYKDDIDPGLLASILDREIWIRLAKIEAVGIELSVDGKSKLDELRAKYPDWQLAEDERDEFPYWTGDGEEWRKFVATPRRRRDLIDWLKQHTDTDRWQEDDWRQRCRDNFATSACALFALSRTGNWPSDRWREALQAWSDEKLLNRSWRYIAPVLSKAPDDLLIAIAHSVSWWLQALAKSVNTHEALFLQLCRRILALDYVEEMNAAAPVNQAINHPVGQVTEALLRQWLRSSPQDAESLPEALARVFTEICNTAVAKFRHGRVLLAAHAIALYRVDQQWTTANLLPLFDWQHSFDEARTAWEGFLWSPRLYRPLMDALKSPFLQTAQHYDHLGDHASQYAALLTFAALDRGDLFSIGEISSATRSLPADGLHEASQALVRALQGAGEQRTEYWEHRVRPYLKKIWPKSHDLITPSISESLGRLCIAAQDAFPEAFDDLKHWLQPTDHSDFLIHQLHEAKLCERHPETALAFLDIVVEDRGMQWVPQELEKCLTSIKINQPNLEGNLRYQKLLDVIRRGNQG